MVDQERRGRSVQVGPIGQSCRIATINDGTREADAVRTMILILIASLGCAAPRAGISDEVPGCDPVPVAIKTVAPRHPWPGTYCPLEGYAVVSYTIARSGHVVEVELIESGSEWGDESVAAGFGRAAVEAVLQWRYEPPDSACRTRQKLSFVVSDEQTRGPANGQTPRLPRGHAVR